MGEYVRAYEEAKKSLKMGEQSTESFELLFESMMRVKGIEETTKYFDGLCHKLKKNYAPCHCLARYFADRAEYNRAIIYMEMAMKRAEEPEKLNSELIRLLSYGGDYYKIPKILNNVSTLPNIEPFHLWNIGVAYRNLNRKEEARRIFEKILTMDLPFDYRKRAEEEIDNLGRV
jgi:tetratricopeptide (TPR) repeat protein